MTSELIIDVLEQIRHDEALPANFKDMADICLNKSNASLDVPNLLMAQYMIIKYRRLPILGLGTNIEG